MTEQESEIDIEGERYVLCREACVNEMNSSLNISRTLPDPERTRKGKSRKVVGKVLLVLFLFQLADVSL